MRTLVLLAATAAALAAEPVTLFMYSEYIDPALEAEFERRTGHDLRIEVYEAQEDMIAKLRTGGTNQYDVVVASDTVLPQMVALKLVQPLDQQRITNRANVAPEWLNQPFDQGNVYSYPYFWGTTGLMYDSRKIQGPATWRWVLDPAAHPGPVVLLDEARSMIGSTLLANGHDINSVDAAQVRAAKDRLVAAKKGPRCLGFDGGVAGKNKVVSGEAVVAVVFSGDAVNGMVGNPHLRYEIPVEGGNRWVDSLLVTAKAPNRAGAHDLINFLLDARIAAQNANFIHYASPVAAARPHLEAADAANPAIYPAAETMKRLHYLRDLGKGSKLWDAAWTAVKSE
jgi:spermidine/putrescine transport system substrate-binding protein